MIKFLCVRGSVFACSCQIEGNGEAPLWEKALLCIHGDCRVLRNVFLKRSQQWPAVFPNLCEIGAAPAAVFRPLLLCSVDQNVSPVMLSPNRGILDCAYINTKCLTNRSCSFNWITRSAPFPLVRLGGSGTGADSPSSPQKGT